LFEAVYAIFKFTRQQPRNALKDRFSHVTLHAYVTSYLALHGGFKIPLIT
jgi:hypothetical protein